MHRRILISAACVISALAAWSCGEKEDGANQSTETYYLELVQETDAELVFNADFDGTYTMHLNTNIPKKYLSLTSVDEQQTWCSASLSKDGNAVEVTPAPIVMEDSEATFLIEISKQVKGVSPLTFVVRKLHEQIAPSITVNYAGAPLEEQYPNIEVSGTAQTLTFTVETNVASWKLEYDNYSDQEWVSVDKLSGRSGETVTVTLSKNESGSARNQTLTFSPAIAGADVSVMVNLTQKAWSSIESVVVRAYDPATMTKGEVLNKGHRISMPCTNARLSPFCFYVEITGEGKVDVMFREPGNDKIGYSDWAFGGRTEIEDEEGNVIDTYYHVSPMDNKPGTNPDTGYVTTGEERSIDVVLVPDGKKIELFKFSLTQAAWEE